MAQLHTPDTPHRKVRVQSVDFREAIERRLDALEYSAEQLSVNYQRLLEYSAVDAGDRARWKKQTANIQRRLSDWWKE